MDDCDRYERYKLITINEILTSVDDAMGIIHKARMHCGATINDEEILDSLDYIFSQMEEFSVKYFDIVNKKICEKIYDD